MSGVLLVALWLGAAWVAFSNGHPYLAILPTVAAFFFTEAVITVELNKARLICTRKPELAQEEKGDGE